MEAFSVAKWGLGLLSRLVVSPLNLEVDSFAFEDMTGKVISAYPRRYRAATRITNRSERTVYIREVKVTIDDRITLTLDPRRKAIRLEPDEPRVFDFTFSLDDDKVEAVVSGAFKLEITPTRGRRAGVPGRFPL